MKERERRPRKRLSEADLAFAASATTLAEAERRLGSSRETLTLALAWHQRQTALPTHCPRCGEQYWVEVATLTGVQWQECRCGAEPVPLRRAP